jgi:hypothetical protein
MLICHFLLFCLVLLNPNGDYEEVSHVVLYICFNEVDCLDPHYTYCLNATASTLGAFVARITLNDLLAAPTKLLFVFCFCLFDTLKAGIP